MSDIGLVQRFGALFAGNPEAWGTESGGCDRTKIAYDDAYQWHLDGTRPCGVYPMVLVGDVWMVKFGVVDFDVRAEGKTRYDYETPADAHAAAVNLVHALDALGLTGWIERTKSDGRHVWVFADSWVPAATMRKALLVGCRVAEVPPTEVNPKSWSLGDGQLGNYIRAPYPGPLVEGFRVDARRMMIRALGDDHLHYFYSLNTFLDDAERSLASLATLDATAEMYLPPVVSTSNVPTFERAVDMSDGLLAKLGPLAKIMWAEGPLPDADRSSFLFKLTVKTLEDGLTADETLALVSAADDKWCRKFTHRTDAQRRYMEMIERASTT